MPRLAAMFSVVLALATWTVPLPAVAQALHSGSRVRIWSSAPRIEGRVTKVTGARDDTVLFRDNPSSEEFSVAKSALTRVDLSMRRGSPVLGTFIGVLLGGSVGIGAGLALGHASVQHDRSTGHCGDAACEFVYLATLPLGFVAGAITGGIVGHHIARESWQHLPDPRQIRIAWALRPHNGIGVAYTVLTQ